MTKQIQTNRQTKSNTNGKKTGQQKNSLKNVPAATPRRQLVGRLRRPGRQLVAGLARPQPLLRHGARRVHAGRLPDEPARRRRRSRRGPPRLPRGQQQPSLCRIGRPSPQQGRRRQARDGEQAGTDQGQGQERAAGGRQVARGELEEKSFKVSIFIFFFRLCSSLPRPRSPLFLFSPLFPPPKK